jgi:hypothetical protein
MTREATLFSATLGEDKKVEPPLGPLYIASALRSVGWDVDFRDYQLFGAANAFDPDLIVECLDGHSTVLMISCFVDMLPVVIAASAAIKSRRPTPALFSGDQVPRRAPPISSAAFPPLTLSSWAKARRRSKNGRTRTTHCAVCRDSRSPEWCIAPERTSSKARRGRG